MDQSILAITQSLTTSLGKTEEVLREAVVPTWGREENVSSLSFPFQFPSPPLLLVRGLNSRVVYLTSQVQIGLLIPSFIPGQVLKPVLVGGGVGRPTWCGEVWSSQVPPGMYNLSCWAAGTPPQSVQLERQQYQLKRHQLKPLLWHGPHKAQFTRGWHQRPLH